MNFNKMTYRSSKSLTCLWIVVILELFYSVTAEDSTWVGKELLESFPNSKQQKHNFGLHNVVLQEHWDAQTTEEVPTLYAESMMVNLTGKIMLSAREFRPINCYQGLRFANKPKRFTPGKLIEYPNPEYKNDEYVADHLPNKCTQHGLIFSHVPAGTEDCLFLSVYTPIVPNLENNTYNELIPVMVFFHGGAFIWGDSSLYLPTRLCDEDVILVVPHYRLGSMGFFTTMDDRAPGNIGLYDQQLAMKWVQNHISDFGGDKDRVTIFGQSAGSASVNYHLLSPSSAGLFKNVIGESGDAVEHWALDPDPIASAFAIAEVVQCENQTNIDAIYECMMNADPGVLALAINELSLLDRLHGSMGFRGTAPIIQNPSMDLSEYGVDVFVSQPPKDYFSKREFNKDVNLMIGANKQEGSFIFGIMYTSYLYPKNLTENGTYLQEQMISDLLYSFGIEDTSHSLSESLAEQYLMGADRTNLDSSTPGMIDLSGVLFMKAGTLETAKLHSYYKNEGVNTYLYAFEFESEDTSFDWLFMGLMDEFSDQWIKGVTHSDELLYLFSWPAVMNGTQFMIRDRLVKLWTNFAKYGDPTPEEDLSYTDLNIPKYQNYDILEEYYMLMEDEFQSTQHYENRWTITNDEFLAKTTSTIAYSTTIAQNTSAITTKTTTPASTTTPAPTVPMVPLSEYESLKKERDAYLTTMIVFIVFSVIAAGVAGFMYFKWRKQVV